MKRLNKEAYNAEPNNLIYDYLHPIDAKNIMVTLPGKAAGVLKRGQVIDFDDGAYAPHTGSGTANCLITDDVAYTETDTEIVASAYINGNYRKSKVITDVELTETDMDNLRIHGILLK